MAQYATQTVTTHGIVGTYNPASGGGDKVIPGPGVAIHVVNGNAAPTVVTIATPATSDSDLAVADRAITVANGTSQFIAIPDTLYRDPSDGTANITWSVTTTVTFAVIRIN